MLIERPEKWLARASHQGKAREFLRRMGLLGADPSKEGLVGATLARRVGEVEVVFASASQVEIHLFAREADGEARPWLVVLDMIQAPPVGKAELERELRRWLRAFRKDRTAKFTVRGKVVRLDGVTAYPKKR